jgi:SAM-dependent methyltransferase
VRPPHKARASNPHRLMKYWDLARIFTRWFRKRRFQQFHALFPPAEYRRVLDIGGTPGIWESLDYPADITLLNIDEAALDGYGSNPRRHYSGMVGDGRRLQFGDKEFDLAFANSVIEHVGDENDASDFAKEMRRVGRALYCQTPNKWFPIEPHLGTVFVHWFPQLLKHYLVVRYLTLWGLMNKPTPQQARDAVADIRLLTQSELRTLFPDAEIHVERFLLLFNKSFIAVRRCA